MNKIVLRDVKEYNLIIVLYDVIEYNLEKNVHRGMVIYCSERLINLITHAVVLFVY